MRIVGDALLHVFEIPRGVFIAVLDQGLERQGTQPTALSVVKDIDGVSRRKMVLSLCECLMSPQKRAMIPQKGTPATMALGSRYVGAIIRSRLMASIKST